MSYKIVEFTLRTVVDVPDDMEKIDIISTAVKNVCNYDYIKDGCRARNCKIFDL